MNRLLLLICLILLAAGCKSVKKAKQQTYALEYQQAEVLTIDSVVSLSIVMDTSREAILTTEEIEETFKAIDSAGIILILPIRITRRTTNTTREDTSQSTASSLDYSATTDKDSSSKEHQSYELDKSSEGADVIEQAAAAIFPTWGKVLASILVAVIPVLWGLWKRKQNME